MAKGCWTTILVLAVVIVLATGYCAYQASKGARPSTAASPRAQPSFSPEQVEKSRVKERGVSAAREEAKAADRRRLFLEDRRWDDDARGSVFHKVLRSAGQRCDDVSRMLMGRPGVWRVTCAPGYVYTFRFDAKGELVSAQRIE